MILLGALVSGCATSLPHFESAINPEPLPPRVSHIVDQIQCEILDAVRVGADATSPLSALQSDTYVANVDLTLDVTDKQGFNPSLSYINPYTTSGNNFTFGLNGQYNRQQQRTMHLTFSLIVEKSAATDDRSRYCRTMREGTGMDGQLGLAEIIGAGLPYQGPGKYHMKVVGIDREDKGLPESADPPAFGSTVDFTLVYGAGGGPNWTLTRFTGIGGGDGLATVQRINKDTLQLAFAKVVPNRQGAVQAADRAAQNLVYRQILNRNNNTIR